MFTGPGSLPLTSFLEGSPYASLLSLSLTSFISWHLFLPSKLCSYGFDITLHKYKKASLSTTVHCYFPSTRAPCQTAVS